MKYPKIFIIWNKSLIKSLHVIFNVFLTTNCTLKKDPFWHFRQRANDFEVNRNPFSTCIDNLDLLQNNCSISNSCKSRLWLNCNQSLEKFCNNSGPENAYGTEKQRQKIGPFQLEFQFYTDLVRVQLIE